MSNKKVLCALPGPAPKGTATYILKQRSGNGSPGRCAPQSQGLPRMTTLLSDR